MTCVRVFIYPRMENLSLVAGENGLAEGVLAVALFQRTRRFWTAKQAQRVLSEDRGMTLRLGPLLQPQTPVQRSWQLVGQIAILVAGISGGLNRQLVGSCVQPPLDQPPLPPKVCFFANPVRKRTVLADKASQAAIPRGDFKSEVRKCFSEQLPGHAVAQLGCSSIKTCMELKSRSCLLCHSRPLKVEMNSACRLARRATAFCKQCTLRIGSPGLLLIQETHQMSILRVESAARRANLHAEFISNFWSFNSMRVLLQWFREGAKVRTNLLKLTKEAADVVEISASSGVIGVPRLFHFRKVSLEQADERREACATRKHGERISLGHAFLAAEKVGSPVVAAEHECPPVSAAIECKPGPQRPLMTDSPQHGCPVLLVECILCINEQKAPILFMLVQLPEVLHRMNTAFNSCFKTSAELINSMGLIGFTASHEEKTFCEQSPPNFINAKWADSSS
jgi:hypothetical protein